MMSARSERVYSDAEIAELLEKAERMGLNLDKGSDLEKLSLDELAQLVETRQ
jgi:hypothetical protein